ncbi:hypothetical protein C8R44DRAFT_855204 [Mycena epipterygia]|nr:hypothetical protein C8R44DRAFT_855204 [Mycena epipterygia]
MNVFARLLLTLLLCLQTLVPAHLFFLCAPDPRSSIFAPIRISRLWIRGRVSHFCWTGLGSSNSRAGFAQIRCGRVSCSRQLDPPLAPAISAGEYGPLLNGDVDEDSVGDALAADDMSGTAELPFSTHCGCSISSRCS